MVRLERFGLREPKIGNLREHFAFARNSIRHDHVKCRNSIARDEKQFIAEVKDLAHFAALDFFDAGQFELQDGFVGWICHAVEYGGARAEFKFKIYLIATLARTVFRGSWHGILFHENHQFESRRGHRRERVARGD